MRGRGERGVDRRLVADRPLVAHVARRVVVNRRVRLRRLRRIDDRRQHLVIDFDQLGGVLRLLQRLGDDDRDLVADVAHLALRQQRMLGSFIGVPSVLVMSQPHGRPPTPREVGAGVDRDARRGSFVAAAVSMPSIVACACGERRNTA